MDKDVELRHLRVGPEAGEMPGGLGLHHFVATCDGDAPRVLRRSREVLEIVVERSSGATAPLPLDEWRRVLPAWFVDACADERSQEEEERRLAWWRGLPQEEKRLAAHNEAWTLSGWVYWFEEFEDIVRWWYWWDGVAENPDTLLVSIEEWDWPLPWGSLEWLLKASGARSVSDALYQSFLASQDARDPENHE